MKFVLEIELGNDAMRSREDVREAVERALALPTLPLVAADPLIASEQGTIRDLNGNTVGCWRVASRARCQGEAGHG